MGIESSCEHSSNNYSMGIYQIVVNTLNLLCSNVQFQHFLEDPRVRKVGCVVGKAGQRRGREGREFARMEVWVFENGKGLWREMRWRVADLTFCSPAPRHSSGGL